MNSVHMDNGTTFQSLWFDLFGLKINLCMSNLWTESMNFVHVYMNYVHMSICINSLCVCLFICLLSIVSLWDLEEGKLLKMNICFEVNRHKFLGL